MNNELVPQELTSGPLSAYNFNDVVSSKSIFLPRLQLFGAKTNACAEGKIRIGHFGLVQDGEIIDLGEELDAVVLSWRPKALQTGDNIITEYDPTTESYQTIRTNSFVKDSGAMFGPEFLLWIPCQNQFVTYFMSGVTGQREAKKVRPLVGCAMTLRCKLINPKSSPHKWHGPVAIACSTPLEVPSIDILQKEVNKFQNPSKSDVELAPEIEDDRVR